jgi:putative FmdB family regulatory protein
MPTYVYKVLKTGKKFEVEQRITEAAWTNHPETGELVERVIQASGIVFKGSGFYKTDSRPSEKSGGKKDKKSDADSGSSSATGPDSSTSNSADSSKAVVSTGSSAAKPNGSDLRAESKPAKPSKKD